MFVCLLNSWLIFGFEQVSRRLQHRVLLIYQHPALCSLDGVTVSVMERQAAEMVFGVEHEVIILSVIMRPCFPIAIANRTVIILQMWGCYQDCLVQPL